MMQSMVRRTVDVPLQHVAGDHISIVDEDSPELDKDEEAEVDIFVEGEQEWEDTKVSRSAHIAFQGRWKRRGAKETYW